MSARCPHCGQALKLFGAILVNPETGTILHEGTSVRVTRRQFDVFTQLAQAKGRPVSRELLWDAMFGHLPDCDEPEAVKNLDVHLHRLRRAIKPLGLAIERNYGRGWSLSSNVPVTA
jgi:DNA-binding response OmpR family regulator